MAGVLCKPPFTEVVEKSRIRCQRSLQDFYQRREQDCSRPAAFKNATVRERPKPARGDFPVDWPVYFASGRLPKSSRKLEFGERGHWRISTGVWANCSRPAAFKNTTVRERPTAVIAPSRERSLRARARSVPSRSCAGGAVRSLIGNRAIITCCSSSLLPHPWRANSVRSRT
jgi:hypothetical protein